MSSDKKVFKGNLITALISQIISSSAGLLISFIVPKFLGVEQFAYWQLFLFYVAYVNIFSIGVFEGVYLKHGGEEYNRVDAALLGTEWRIHVLIQAIIAASIAIFLSMNNMDSDRKFVLTICCLCIVIINANDFLGRLLQAVNKTKAFSFSVIIYNMLWFVAVGIIAIGKIYSYKIIVIMYMLGHVCAGIYLVWTTRRIIFAPLCNLKIAVRDMVDNVKVGVNLFIANYSSNLIIGSVRYLVDWFWGITIFGKVSFSLQISYFFLRFINQVSMVMFPALRRIEKEKASEIFISVNKGLDLLLPMILLGYVPMSQILSVWLPQYSESLKYLIFMFPICVFDGKLELLYYTYYKVLRKEKKLMGLNVSTMIVSIVTTLLLMKLSGNLILVLVGILFTLGIRCYRAYKYLSTIYDHKTYDFLWIVLLVVMFVVITWMITPWMAFGIYLCIYLMYLYIYRKDVKVIIGMTSVFLEK